MNTIRILLLLLAVSVGVSKAAITEQYVSADGTGDGSSEGAAMSWADMVTAINAGSKAGYRYNVKLGNYSRGASDAISGSGTASSPVIIRGYNSTIGDGYTGRTNTSNGLITNNFPHVVYSAAAYYLNITGSYLIFEALYVTGSRNGALVSFGGTGGIVHWCSVKESASGSNGAAVSTTGTAFTLMDCDIEMVNGGNAGSAAIGAAGARVIATRVKSSNTGISASSATMVNGCQVYGSVVGITNSIVSGTLHVINSTITGCTDGIGVVGSQTTGTTYSINNLITDNSGNGINANGNFILIANNRFRNNGTNISGSDDCVAAQNWGVVTSGATSDYVDSTVTDYRLATGSPARFAGVLPYIDIGGVQSTNTATASGGGGVFPFVQ